MPEWPEELPFLTRLGSTLQDDASNLLRGRMDVGPERVRPRTSISVEAFRGRTAPMTGEQRGLFRRFYYDTLSHGALRFEGPAPHEGGTATYRFVGGFREEWTASGPVISATLEVLS